MFGSGEELSDFEMLSIFESESGSCELELEDIGIVSDLFFSNKFELGFDRRNILSWHFFGCGEGLLSRDGESIE